MSWILNSVSLEISASIIFSELASDIWTDRKERFQQSNGPRNFQLHRELINLTQDQLFVGAYFTKLKSLWEALSKFCVTCTCGRCLCGGVRDPNLHHQMDYTMIFLMGLNESYLQVRGQILLSVPIPHINKVFSLISKKNIKDKLLHHKLQAVYLSTP